jgi:putative transposase
MKRIPYASDLTEEQWQLIEPWIPRPKPGGRPRTVNLREVINAILYLNRTGCAWRLLPHEFPPWGTVHYYYRRFRLEGVWPRIHDRLREQVRRKEGRKPTPSAAILDSQTVKTGKGGSGGTTRARRSKGVNAMSW